MAPGDLGSWPDRPVTVRTPATSANLGPGFDALGLALGLHDEVRAQVTSGGLAIEVTGIGEHTARLGEQHLVVRAMRAAFDALGGQPPGIALSCANAIPHGFGLGSSAAAIVAGMLTARALTPGGAGRLPDEAVLALAADFEGHADNVAACLAGGLTIAWRSRERVSERGGRGGTVTSGGPVTSGAEEPGPGGRVRCVRLEPLAMLTPVLCVPATPLSTEAARAVLPGTVPHADAAANAARAALLITALAGGGSPPDLGVLLDATRDFLHQPYRASSMPATAELIGMLRADGIPAVVSGAGPAALALTVPGITAEPGTVAAIASGSAHEWKVRALEIDRDGAVVTP